MIEVELPDGTIAEFPDDMAPEQIEAVLAAQFGGAPGSPARQAEPVGNRSTFDRVMAPAYEFASAANRSVLGALDIVPGAINDALQFAGSDYRVPGFEQTLGNPGGFMEPGLTRDAVSSAGSVLPAAVGGGAAVRQLATGLPSMAAGGESVTAGLLRQLAQSTPGADAALGAVSGAGSALGGQAGEMIGGEEGRQVGQLVGGIAAPVAGIGAASALRSSSQKAADIAQRIAAGSRDQDLAGVTLRPAKPAEPGAVIVGGKPVKVVADEVADEALKQGVKPGVVQSVKASSDKTRERMLRQLKISERGKSDDLYAQTNRPGDVAGESLAARLRFLKSVNESAGKNLDRVANTLRNKPADMKDVAQRFGAALDDAGVTVGDDGALNFRGSDFEDLKGVNNIISTVYRRANHIFETGDAYQAHRLKRFIDEQVSYGKSNAEGLTGKSERMLKALRADIDAALDKQFPRYNRVNTRYSDTIREIDAFQDAAGTKVDLFGPNADKALGVVSRRLMGNTQSRANMLTAIDSMEKTAQKYGAKFGDDIIMQARFADVLDEMFGAAARTSLQGEMEKATARGVSKISNAIRNPVQASLDTAAAGVDKMRGINEKNAYKALRALLARKSLVKNEPVSQ